MRFKSFLMLALATTSLAACMQDPASRGVGGALAGAALADAMDENLLAGAALGAAGGVATCYIPGALECQQGY
jgi:osmotically inducible lipoprotein OsmB